MISTIAFKPGEFEFQWGGNPGCRLAKLALEIVVGMASSQKMSSRLGPDGWASLAKVLDGSMPPCCFYASLEALRSHCLQLVRSCSELDSASRVLPESFVESADYVELAGAIWACEWYNSHRNKQELEGKEWWTMEVRRSFPQERNEYRRQQQRSKVKAKVK
jgi:hypothetical protein